MEIGFSTSALDLEERERARIYEICASAVEKRWGSVLLGHVYVIQIQNILCDHDLRPAPDLDPRPLPGEQGATTVESHDRVRLRPQRQPEDREQ